LFEPRCHIALELPPKTGIENLSSSNQQISGGCTLAPTIDLRFGLKPIIEVMPISATARFVQLIGTELN
jgi:hypothetical protein